MIAFIRPNDYDLPLFVHVLGAMLLVGSLVLVLLSLISAWRSGNLEQVRLAYRGLVFGVLPSWIVMRVGAQLMLNKEFPDQKQYPGWVDTGFMTAEPGLVLLLIATVLVGTQVRRARGARSEPTASRPATLLVSLILVAYVYAIYAMTTKPG